VSISACSLESAGTANAAESVCSGSTGFPAILASFGVCNVKACPVAPSENYILSEF
jgi:hypothetical protein